MALKEPMITLLAKDEWAAKIQAKFSRGDWDLMAKVVNVLKVCQASSTIVFCFLHLFLSG